MRNYKIKITILFLILFRSVLSFADGFIVVPEPKSVATSFPLEVRFHKVNVEVKNSVAKTTIDQEFYNPYNTILEGYYIFPIPEGAVIEKFSMYINGKEQKAEMLNASKARSIYEGIVRQMKDPALLEYAGRGMLKARIYPIEGRSVKRVKISYREIINSSDSSRLYLYPMNTEKFSSKPLKNVSLYADIKSDRGIGSVLVPNFETDIVRKNKNHVILSYEDKNVKPEKDFGIFYSEGSKEMDMSLLTYREDGEKEGYFFLEINPGNELDKMPVIKKDITFILDTSGSMRGDKISQAKKALSYCINNLNKGDRFQIIRFSTEAESLFSGLSENNNTNRKKALDFINDMEALGGTNIEEAFDMAKNSDSNRPHMIVFMTDGRATIGTTDENQLLKNIERTNKSKIFTFGIGYDINTLFLDKITAFSKTFSSYISPSENIETEIASFYNKVKSPFMTDIKVEFNGNVTVSKVYPNSDFDIYRGSSVSILGSYKGSGKCKIIVSGRVNDKNKSYSFTKNFKKNDASNDFIPQIWASRRIGDLLEKIRLYSSTNELVDEVTILARRYGIITPYTSYLIVEDERKQVAQRRIKSEEQTIGNQMQGNLTSEKKLKSQYSRINKNSGKGGVESSESIKEMNDTDNYAKLDKSRESYLKNNINSNSIYSLQRSANGRIFYNTGNQWIDSKILETSKNRTLKIKYGSKKYYQLYKNNPKINKILSLGRNIKFIHNNVLYEIYE